MKGSDFAHRLLAWWDHSGRKDLPWQHDPTPYRVWVSEVMLQQTQVATVIPYYERFTRRFRDIVELADAESDEVLAHWAGLGYYSRARNLHQAAQLVRDQHAGCFPETFESVSALPGIGRSTAGAILALAKGQRHPILDGNVKRVLTRHRAIGGWTGSSTVQKKLWNLAEALTPQNRVDDYTQAIMDLGATLCSRRRPACTDCPVRQDCAARNAGEPERYPEPKPRRVSPVRSTRMLLCRRDGAVLLQQRPPTGIWGGLWSLPEPAEGEAVDEWCRRRGLKAESMEEWPTLRHTFSHFRLDITPVVVVVSDLRTGPVMEPDGTLWYKTDLSNQLGLPAPVARLLERLGNGRSTSV